MHIIGMYMYVRYCIDVKKIWIVKYAIKYDYHVTVRSEITANFVSVYCEQRYKNVQK